jgi:hypothetical protein
MSVEFNQLRDTRAILEAVKTSLANLTITIGDKTPKAFGTVEIFDLADWEVAIQKLVISSDRVALVLWGGDSYENNRQITVLSTRRTSKVEILITDYRIDDGVAGQLGDATQPGSVGLLDAVLAELTGVIIDEGAGKDAVTLMPAGTERLTITDADQQESPGRNIISVTFDAVGQWMQVATRSSTLN